MTVHLNDFERNKTLDKPEWFFLNFYLENLEKDISLSRLNDESCIGNLLILSELMPFITDKTYWQKNIYLLLKKINIPDYINTLNIGLLQGFTGVVFAVNQLSNVCPDVRCTFYEYENTLFSVLDGYIAYCCNHVNNLYNFQYDTISGLAGIGFYLLECGNPTSKTLITRIIEYFLYLFESTQYEEKWPRWFIKGEHQPHGLENSKLQKGYMDFGLAHGLAGPMLFMAKACETGYSTPSLQKSLQDLISFYFNYYYLDNGMIQWPSQLSLENYIHKISKEEIRTSRSSWCYGNTSILIALNRACKAIKLESYQDMIAHHIFNLVHQDLSKHNLVSPILCHGYAGLLMFYLYAKHTYHINDIDMKINEIQQKILQMFDPKYYYGFINCAISDVTSKLETFEMYDLLNGPCGVVLSLISTFKQNTNWEKIILYK